MTLDVWQFVVAILWLTIVGFTRLMEVDRLRSNPQPAAEPVFGELCMFRRDRDGSVSNLSKSKVIYIYLPWVGRWVGKDEIRGRRCFHRVLSASLIIIVGFSVVAKLPLMV